MLVTESWLDNQNTQRLIVRAYPEPAKEPRLTAQELIPDGYGFSAESKITEAEIPHCR